MDIFNTKKLAKNEALLSSALIELHDLKILKDNVINFFYAEKIQIESDILKEKRKKRPCNDKLFILSELKAKIGEAQNRTIDNFWSR